MDMFLVYFTDFDEFYMVLLDGCFPGNIEPKFGVSFIAIRTVFSVVIINKLLLYNTCIFNSPSIHVLYEIISQYSRNLRIHVTIILATFHHED